MFSEDTMERGKEAFMTFHMTKYHECLFGPLCNLPQISFLMLAILSLHSFTRLTSTASLAMLVPLSSSWWTLASHLNPEHL